MSKALVAVVVLLLLSAAAARGQEQVGELEVVGAGGLVPPGRYATVIKPIERQEFGADWPLTVDRAILVCSLAAPLPPMTVLLVVDGRVYALNGTTKGQARGGRYRWSLSRGEWLPVVVDDAPAWWAAGTATPKKYLGPIFDAARSLGCLNLRSRAP